jgi:hypothetical protein
MSSPLQSSREERAVELATHFAAFPQVVAVALGGSQSSGTSDLESDIDLYVYTDRELPLAAQSALIEQFGGATRADLNLPYWGGVNEWIDTATGIAIDCMYFGAAWIEEQITRVFEMHQPSLGYSTCFCRTVQQSRVLYDPQGWLQSLQARCTLVYPETLRHNIINHNYPVLRTIISSYLAQIEKAVRRNDLVSINHRMAALLANYFDIVFALNRVLHPGEKRLLTFARKECALLPTAMETDIAAVLLSAGTASDTVVMHLTRLLDRLDERLREVGFDLRRW